MKNYVRIVLDKHASIVNPQTVISKESTEDPEVDNSKKGSFLDEDAVTRRLIRGVPNIKKYCVDIGASDGVSMSNTFSLFKSGWEGLGLECVPEKFIDLAKNLQSYKAHLSNSMVNPDNVLNILKAYDTPKNFGFLNLDIDGYDYYVLDKLLTEYVPTIICAEINEKIPPPIKFTVKYEKGYFWNSTHFYGQSISQIDSLCRKRGYVLADLHYNNVFYVKKEKYSGKSMTAEEAYKKGYKNQADRKVKFPWNEDFEEIFSYSPKDQVKFVQKKFEKHKGKFSITL